MKLEVSPLIIYKIEGTNGKVTLSSAAVRIINEPRKYVYPATGTPLRSELSDNSFFLLFIRRKVRRRVRRAEGPALRQQVVRLSTGTEASGGFSPCASCTNRRIICHVFHDVTLMSHEGRGGGGGGFTRHKCFRGDLHLERRDRSCNDPANPARR
jgi:hypothetical protein